MSSVHITPHSVSFDGRDAVELYTAIALRSGLRLYINTQGKLKPSRQWTLRKALKACEPFTGQTYKASQPEAQRALADLTVWIETMKSALPIFNTEPGA